MHNQVLWMEVGIFSIWGNKKGESNIKVISIKNI